MVAQHHCCYFWWWSRGCIMPLSFPQMENLESKCSLTLGLMHHFLRLQLANFSGVIQFQGESACVLQEKIHSLLKRAISVISPEPSLSGFYSRWIPLLQSTPCRLWTHFCREYMFRMLSQVVLLYLVRANNSFLSPPHRQFCLISLSQGVVWIPCSPIWPFSQPEGLLYPARMPGHMAGHAVGRLVPVSAVRTDGQGSHMTLLRNTWWTWAW